MLAQKVLIVWYFDIVNSVLLSVYQLEMFSSPYNVAWLYFTVRFDSELIGFISEKYVSCSAGAAHGIVKSFQH